MTNLIKISIVVLVFLVTLPSAHAQSCSSKKSCAKMKSCKEAAYYLNVCGHKERDRDNDGIPCEKLCGKSMKQYKERLAAGK
ncbi:excalibur calcium-binding domain-containing protein [uncultured Cohaesibacter sp.]|uniref:excalibur calcium-binding domain-containing protein n=1 Tax=uncultured Cohaesibacter sp. TaxID=1002546 RepID=UPI003749A6CE